MSRKVGRRPSRATQLRLGRLVARSSLRAVAGRIHVSYFVVYKIVEGRPVQPSTLEVVEEWLSRQGGDEAGQELRRALRRALRALPQRKLLAVEGELGQVIKQACTESGKPTPAWVDDLGKKRG